MNIGRKACKAVPAGILVFLLAASASAAELRFIEVEREDGRYFLQSTTWFDADIEAVYSVLIDYDLYHRFSGAIAESRNLDPDQEGRPEYYTRMEGCVLIWCQSFVRIGHLRLEPIKRIEAITDPERSDFLFSRESWELTEADGGTLLVYEFEMVPDFWVPPVVGPYFIKRALRSGGAKAADRIEVIALEEQATRTASEP